MPTPEEATDPLEQAWETLAAELETRPELPQYLTVAQVAKLLALSDYTVRTYAKSGALAGTKIGPNGLWRFTRQAVLDFMGHRPTPCLHDGCGCTGHLPDAR